MAIHPTAVVAPDAKLGRDVEIGPYAVIEDHTVIGDGAFIDCHAKIARYTEIGARTRVYMGALVGEAPQDHRFKPGTVAWTRIGCDSVIREYVTIHRSPFENGETRVGDGTLLMAFVHIGHDAVIGNHVTIANSTAVSGHVVIEDGAVLSGYILIHQFCRIGSLAMVGARVIVRQDIPPFALLSEEGWICGPNVVGLRRAGFDAATRGAIKRAIKIYFYRGLNAHNALEEIEAASEFPQVKHFAAFIRETKRGIMPPDPVMASLGTHDEDDEP